MRLSTRRAAFFSTLKRRFVFESSLGIGATFAQVFSLAADTVVWDVAALWPQADQ